MARILHICPRSDWDAGKAADAYTAASLETEGFIHGSAVEQVVETVNLYFKGQAGLKLLLIDPTLLSSSVKYESPAGSGGRDPSLRFPHIYGTINLDAVLKAVDFPASEDGSFVLPDLSEYIIRL